MTNSAIPSQEYQLAQARSILQNADRVLIGAGAGLSTAAGLAYSGPRFQERFAAFIKRFGMTDMYSAGFYPFPTQEDKWAYWSLHSWVNRFEPGAMPLYRELFAWARERDYFVITTNVDAQFELAGFERGRIFAPQGDYGYVQCRRGCHERIYPAKQTFTAMLADTNFGQRTHLEDSSLVPTCPVCGGPMEMHLRCDGYFVEDAEWHAAQARYQAFIAEIPTKPTVLLELGVGWNTPVWIRYPFEHIASTLGSPLVRMNYDDAAVDTRRMPNAAGVEGDIAQTWPLVTKI